MGICSVVLLLGDGENGDGREGLSGGAGGSGAGETRWALRVGERLVGTREAGSGQRRKDWKLDALWPIWAGFPCRA